MTGRCVLGSEDLMDDTTEFGLHRRLAWLETDLDAVVLPGAAAARKRGTQRTRHHLTAAALGAAVVVGSLGIVQVDPTSAPAPATTPSKAVTPPDHAPTESAGVSEPSPLSLDDSPFLDEIDIDPVGTYAGFGWVDGWDLGSAEYAHVCLPDLADVGAGDVQRGVWAMREGEGTFIEFALQMPDAEAAAAFIAGQVVLPDQCGEVSETHVQNVNQPTSPPVAGADDALVWTVGDRPRPDDLGSEGSFGGVGMARTGNIVVVIYFTAFGDPTDGGWSDYAARTLGTALDRATG